MLVEIAIADAYGAGFEFRPQEGVDQLNDLTGYRPHEHPRTGVPPGSYTDDTQMTIALAELALTKEPWSLYAIAKVFLETYKRDPRPWAYSHRMHEALAESAAPAQLLRTLATSRSTGSGAVMRVLPCALGGNLPAAHWRACLQAEVTHNTCEADLAARCVAQAAFRILGGDWHEPVFDLDAPWRAQDFTWGTSWEGRVPAAALPVARAAITVASEARSLKDALKRSVAFGGDTDTVAAIAVGLCSLAGGDRMKRDLPVVLYDRLEDGPYGRRYLEDLDDRLAAAFDIPASEPQETP